MFIEYKFNNMDDVNTVYLVMSWSGRVGSQKRDAWISLLSAAASLICLIHVHCLVYYVFPLLSVSIRLLMNGLLQWLGTYCYSNFTTPSLTTPPPVAITPVNMLPYINRCG